MKTLLTTVALAATLSLGAAGATHAATYLLNVDGCTNGCGYSSYGTVTTTGEGTTSLGVTIQLAANVYFNMSGHPEEAFDLANNPQIHIAGLTDPPWNVHNDELASAHAEPFFGNFDYAIDWDGTFLNAQHPGNGFPSSNGCLTTCGIQTLSFTVTPHNGTTALTPDFTVKNGQNIYFTVDVAGYNPTTHTVINTGHVGATLAPAAVPEPATWAMMLVGFGGLGALLRRRRQAAALA
jgi:hypothetical protein